MAILRMKGPSGRAGVERSDHRRRPWHGPDDEQQEAIIGQALAGRPGLSDPARPNGQVSASRRSHPPVMVPIWWPTRRHHRPTAGLDFLLGLHRRPWAIRSPLAFCPPGRPTGRHRAVSPVHGQRVGQGGRPGLPGSGGRAIEAADVTRRHRRRPSTRRCPCARRRWRLPPVTMARAAPADQWCG